MIATLLLLAALQEPALKNGNFEAKEPKPGALVGWNVAIGLKQGGTEPASDLALDTVVKRNGQQSLRLSGDAKTRAWKIVTQEIDVRPSSIVKLHGFAKTDAVHPEKPAGATPQQPNCYLGLAILDKTGAVIAKDQKTPKLPALNWHELSMEIVAPDNARKARVTIFLSMTGKFWMDDVACEVQGGRDLPKPEVVFQEGFEKEETVASEWREIEATRTGPGDSRVTIAIDPDVGAPGSPRSLTFSGNSSTARWFALQRSVPAVPGEVVRVRALIKTSDVKMDKGQVGNINVHVFFRDKSGQNLCAPQYGNGLLGTYDWREIAVEAVAPVGTTEACFGVLFSMSGQVWYDKLEVTRTTGDTPAFNDWEERQTLHFTMRYPKDHPQAAQMAQLGATLDAAFETLVEKLGIRFSDKITAYFYRDAAQGKALASRDLDFAEPEARAIHLGPGGHPPREIAKVLLRKLGFPQTDLLGEGVPFYFDGEAAEEHHAVAAKLLADGKLPSLDTLLNKFKEDPNAATAAASFAGYVLETKGAEKLKRLYVLGEPMKNAHLVLDKPLTEVDAAWREWLSKGRSPAGSSAPASGPRK